MHEYGVRIKGAYAADRKGFVFFLITERRVLLTTLENISSEQPKSYAATYWSNDQHRQDFAIPY